MGIGCKAELKAAVMDKKLVMVAKHFRCSCGHEEFDYLVSAARPDGSSWDTRDIMIALGLKPGDRIEIRKV